MANAIKTMAVSQCDIIRITYAIAKTSESNPCIDNFSH